MHRTTETSLHIVFSIWVGQEAKIINLKLFTWVRKGESAWASKPLNRSAGLIDIGSCECYITLVALMSNVWEAENKHEHVLLVFPSI